MEMMFYYYTSFVYVDRSCLILDGQVVDEYSQRLPLAPQSTMAQEVSGDGGGGAITIGVALEATALTAGQKHVDKSEAAAIQAAEVRATGRTNVVPGGIAAAAQSAATHNARATTHEDKTKLADVLSVIFAFNHIYIYS
jgi:hypothetical protein